MIRRIMIPVLVLLGVVLILPVAMADRQTDRERINRYFVEWKQFSARFHQESSVGLASGNLYISRPGKIRVEYDAPTPHRIIADGQRLIFYDWQLDAVSERSIDETPAAILLDDNLVLGQRFHVEKFFKKDGVIRLRVVDQNNPNAGALDLTFDDDPLTLKQWAVVDVRGVMTSVILSDMKKIPSFDPSFFQFRGLRLDRTPFATP